MDAELVEVFEQKTGMMKTAFEGSQLAGVPDGPEGRAFPTGHRGQEGVNAAGFQEWHEGRGWMVGQASR